LLLYCTTFHLSQFLQSNPAAAIQSCCCTHTQPSHQCAKVSDVSCALLAHSITAKSCTASVNCHFCLYSLLLSAHSGCLSICTIPACTAITSCPTLLHQVSSACCFFSPLPIKTDWQALLLAVLKHVRQTHYQYSHPTRMWHACSIATQHVTGTQHA